ncbi:hypothetical protein [Clostridium estertheticum]|uniref:hypothetical protein n=1 Tax=Clostridium estertheticum TaxID=238834 RepID=UPI001CF38343|nr:hypothetical protein [Clostridium estertheticum]MCB2340682.1 hypothetical protein [Clostridium estertheticum]
MKNKYQSKSRIMIVGIMTIMITLSMVGLNVFSSSSIKVTAADIKRSQKSTTVDGSPLDNGENSFSKYLSLLGINREKLINILKEKPESIDEGGLEFKKAGIRIWFDTKSYTLVDQIFIMNKYTDINGVKIGDNISSFKKVFGRPISDKNGDVHFKYKNVFLSVNYDVLTGKTYGVYILKNDF